ncbi:MAG: radical SAM protein, partial [Actinomycetota bacterium]|nr:radical SAM protein [Actinomycetota bacterium]
PWFHLLPGDRPLVWSVGGSQLFEVTASVFDQLAVGDPAAVAALAGVSLAAPAWPDTEPEPPVAMSLALAQSCNLSCSYCYADGGQFGGRARRMPLEVARRAIDTLVEGAGGRRVTLGFIGGEVLLHREVLHQVVDYADQRAAAAGVPIAFSITTNGTLVTPADVALFRSHRFAVTVSLDGDRTTNDTHRRSRRGDGSFERVVAAVVDLLADPGRAKVAARTTVTRRDLAVHERVEALAAVGFAEVGVSPLRTGPDHEARFAPNDWAPFLAEMVRAADAEVERVTVGHPPRFTNLSTSLREIHRGSARPLPCGSARTYVAVGADGDFWTCHRTVDNPAFRLGDLDQGLSRAARQAFLDRRQVDAQEPCRSCWARYLCGGGCHAEVDEVGREGCDFIRGWLEHCISVYAECQARGPEVLESMGVST